jgi:hypothetical protein
LIRITINLTPEVKHDDTFRHPVSSSIYEDFVDYHFILGAGGSLRMNDFYVAIVKLVGLRDLYGRSILPGNTSLRSLECELGPDDTGEKRRNRQTHESLICMVRTHPFLLV